MGSSKFTGHFIRVRQGVGIKSLQAQVRAICGTPEPSALELVIIFSPPNFERNRDESTPHTLVHVHGDDFRKDVAEIADRVNRMVVIQLSGRFSLWGKVLMYIYHWLRSSLRFISYQGIGLGACGLNPRLVKKNSLF